jgi:hypothetical protein
VISMVSQTGISALMKREGLTSWSNSGSGKSGFKTSVWLEDADGVEITTVESSPIPIWDYAPTGSVIKYEVETITKGVSKPDRFQLDIGYANDAAVIREYNGIINGLPEEQRKRFDEGSKVMEDSVIKLTEQAIIDKSIPPVINIYSKTLNTDDTGKLTGTIPIDSSWPKSTYNMMFHYGYQGDSEGRSDWAETGKNLVAVVEEIVIIAIAFIPVVGTAAAIALTVAQVAYAIADAMLWTGYGMATENKYGAKFPDYGFSHPYGFGTDVSLAQNDSVMDFGMGGSEKFIIPAVILGIILLLRG